MKKPNDLKKSSKMDEGDILYQDKKGVPRPKPEIRRILIRTVYVRSRYFLETA